MQAYKLSGHILWREGAHPHSSGFPAGGVTGAGVTSVIGGVTGAGTGIGTTAPAPAPAPTPTTPTWTTDPVYIENGVFTRKPTAPTHKELNGWVLPGLTDVHCHIGIVSSGAADHDTTLTQARDDVRSGVTLVRDCGVPRDTTIVDQQIEAPRIIRCGQHLVKPKRYIRNYGRELTSDSELPEAMVEEAHRGNGWVKLVGDWIDRSEGADSRLRPLWDGNALKDGVAAVHECGGRVTVHTFSHQALDDLIDAGVDCIEHATGADADHIAEIVARGIPVTPTVLQVDRFKDFAAAGAKKYPEYARQMQTMFDQRIDHFAQLWDAGVHFLPGTDAGGYQSHGVLPVELQQWLRFGAQPQQVIDSATWKVRDFLRQPVIEEGAPADCVIYADDPTRPTSSDNPLGGLATLTHPVAVIRAGHFITPHVKSHQA